MSQQRNISGKRINEIINNLELNSSKKCKQLNFIDDLKYEDEVITFLENKSKNIIDFNDYMDVI